MANAWLRKVWENQAARARSRVGDRVISERSGFPAKTKAAVSQKLSQQYSSQKRVRPATSRGESFVFLHSADHPASPRARVCHSDLSNASQAPRRGLPRRTQTK